MSTRPSTGSGRRERARFLGVSTHTPRLVQVANQAIDSGLFDVMMLAYHHGIWSKLNEIILRAHQEQDMGIVAMKTLKGGEASQPRGIPRREFLRPGRPEMGARQSERPPAP